MYGKHKSLLAYRRSTVVALNDQRLASGYVDCACRDCFDVAVSSGGPALCQDCRAAGCDVTGHSDCDRTDAYEASKTMADGDQNCAYCGEHWPCSDSQRKDISGDERAKHHLSKLARVP